MASVTLHDYAGYIMLEMIRARESADAYSRAVAERYSADPVLRFFPAPRFKLPKVELTLPMLVSGAKFNEILRLDLPREQFVATVVALAAEVRMTVETAQDTTSATGPSTIASPAPSSIQRMAERFHSRLTANPDPGHPEEIVRASWAEIFQLQLDESALAGFYQQWDPHRELLARTTREVLDRVTERTVVEHTKILSLEVDPETAMVKNGSGEASVFVIKADLLEEGVYVRTVRDDASDQTHPVVEFE